MTEKKFTRLFRVSKIIQVCIVFALEISVYVILLCNPDLARQLYSNKALLLLCGCFWLLMLFILLCFLCDFYHLRRFAEENHSLNKTVYLDNLTGIPNRHGLDVIFQTYASPVSFANVGCLLISITNLKDINQRLGHAVGDETIKSFCNIFEETGDSYGVLGRNSGNEYVLVVKQCDHALMQGFISELSKKLDTFNAEHTDTPIHVRHAYVLNSETKAKTFSQLLAVASSMLHS